MSVNGEEMVATIRPVHYIGIGEQEHTVAIGAESLQKAEFAYRYVGEQLIPSPHDVLILGISKRESSHLVAEFLLRDATKFGVEKQVLCTVLFNIIGKHPTSYLTKRFNAAFRVKPHEHSTKVEYYILYIIIHTLFISLSFSRCMVSIPHPIL